MTTPKTETLANAAEAIGGNQALARTLGCSVEIIDYWRNEWCEIPERIYQEALEITARRPAG